MSNQPGTPEPGSEPPRAETPELGDVEETLLIPLYFRARESSRPKSLFFDKQAVEILPQLRYDFSPFDRAWRVENDVVVRTALLDEQVNRFLEQHPDALIINLGAGLDARFWRVDNQRLRWFDVDTPDAMALRCRFLEQSPRHTFIAKSMFDESWIDQVDPRPNEPTLIIAEALLFYFTEDQIRQLFAMLSQRLPGSEILFQTIAPKLVGREGSVPAVNRTNAEFRWGIHSGRELSQWNPEYEFIDEWSLVDFERDRWSWLRWLMWLPPLRTYLREVMKITHMRLADASREASRCPADHADGDRRASRSS